MLVLAAEQKCRHSLPPKWPALPSRNCLLWALIASVVLTILQIGQTVHREEAPLRLSITVNVHNASPKNLTTAARLTFTTTSASSGGKAARMAQRRLAAPMKSTAPCGTSADRPELPTPREADLQQQRYRALQKRGGGGYLGICVAVRDQHKDLPEWIEFHRRMGASQIYVMDTGSQPRLDTVLQPYIKAGVVTHRVLTNFTAAQKELQDTTCHTYSPQFQQLIAYAFCLRDYGARHRFMAFIDVDEFLVTNDGKPDLPAVLRDFEEYGGVAVNWRMFGSGGHEQQQPSTLLAYTKCYPKQEPENLHVKTIANTAFTIRLDGAHHAMYAPGYHAVNTAKQPVDGPKSTTVHYSRLALNHYVTKSKQDYLEKMARGSGMGRRKNLAYWHHVQHRAVNTCTAAADAWRQRHGQSEPAAQEPRLEGVLTRPGAASAAEQQEHIHPLAPY